MCGVVGVSGRVDIESLGLSLREVAHRGPDDFGLFVDSDSGIGLGHVRLSILDLSEMGHQPMSSSDGRVVLAFNGEIYNFQELRTELEACGRVFRGRSDTEVLLNLYLELGEEMLPRLNGIFALAIWDHRRQLLILARDALGVKPLYFANVSAGFVFGSEIKGIVAMAPELREIDACAIHRYLTFLWCPGDATPFRAVRKLNPGEALTVRRGKIEKRWSWYRLPSLDLDSASPNGHHCIAATSECLRRAVRRQMVADVPVGAFLSGGLDSSAVVAFAREVNPDIRCFTIDVGGGPEAGVDDDLPFARLVARHLAVPLEVVSIDSGRMASDLEEMVAQLDEPLADPAALNVLYISRMARAQGVKVLLSGVGGDDLFSGYRRHHAAALDDMLRWIPKAARVALSQLSAGMNPGIPWMRRAAKVLGGLATDGDERLVNYFRWVQESDLKSLYSSDFLDQVQDCGATDPLKSFLSGVPASMRPLDRALMLDQRFFLADHNLLYTDKMSMAAGVEVRVPFLDLDLVRHAAGLPCWMKHRKGEGKWVLKKAMEPYLPSATIYRRKTGFGAPVRRWMRSDLREVLGDLLSTASVRRRGIFDAEAVQRLMMETYRGRVDGSYTLLAMLCVEIWCRRFIDRSLIALGARSGPG